MMAYNNSSLLAMSPLTTQSNNLHRHRETADGSNYNAASNNDQQEGSSSSSNLHQIPFQATPVQHGPTPLTFGFGFGFGSSMGSSSTSGMPAVNGAIGGQQWNSPATQASPSPRHNAASRQVSAAFEKRRSETKRRRDSISDDSDDEMEGGREKSASPMSYNRVISTKQALPKRMRAGLGAVGLLNLNDSRSTSPRVQQNTHQTDHGASSAGPSSGSAIDKMDLGKILSTLDKPSLLTLFSRLLTTSNDPTLRDQIIAQIPSPSLESVESALDEIERVIRNASARSGEMRAEFAWGRLRNPVGDFVATALGFMPFFIDDAKDGSVLSLRQETPHPSTSFAFLQALSIRTLRIIELLPSAPTTLSTSLFSFDGSKTFQFGSESASAVKVFQELLPSDALTSANPNTIVTQLLPNLLVRWTRLQDKLCKGVNEEGRMFGSEMMRGWIISLEALGQIKGGNDNNDAMKIEERAFRNAMDNICAQLEQGVGWLIGLHSRSNSSNQQTWRSPGMSARRVESTRSASRASTYMEEEEL